MSYEYMQGLGIEGGSPRLILGEAERLPAPGSEPSIDMDFATQESLEAAGITSPATTEKDTGFFEDIGSAFSSMWDKMSGGDQTAIAAEDIAREEGGVAKMQMAPTTTPAPAASPAAVPPSASVVVEPERSWAAQYAPYMIFGGLGVGAVVVLVLAMRKKKDGPSW